MSWVSLRVGVDGWWLVLWIACFGVGIDMVCGGLVVHRKRSDCSVSQVRAVLAEALVKFEIM